MENRSITAGIGILFVALAVFIVLVAENGWMAYLAALVVGGLGLDAIVAALQGRRSLISRIGPLP
jgi:hypothetical protein